jgi:hypothetical protein
MNRPCLLMSGKGWSMSKGQPEKSNLDDRAGRHPVNEQPGREAGDERCKRHRQESHHPPLTRVDVPRGHLPGQDEHRGREQRQYEIRIRPREVDEPEKAAAGETREALLVAAHDLIHGYEHRHLHQDGQEPSQGVHPTLPVKFHYGFMLLSTVVLVSGTYLSHLGPEPLHGPNAPGLTDSKREQGGAHRNGEQDNAQPPWRSRRVKQLEGAAYQASQRAE